MVVGEKIGGGVLGMFAAQFGTSELADFVLNITFLHYSLNKNLLIENAGDKILFYSPLL